MEGATVFCKMRGNPYVEFVHWLAQIVQLQDSDLHRIMGHYELDPARLSADMTRALDALPRGATTITDLSRASGGRDGTGLGLRLAAVQFEPGAHRPSDPRHA